MNIGAERWAIPVAKGHDPDLRLKVLEVKDELDRTIWIRTRWKAESPRP